MNVNELVATKTVIKKDTTKKPLLEGIVNRKAKDYERMDQRKNKLTLYNQAELYYQDLTLKSGIIVLDYNKNDIENISKKYGQFFLICIFILI